MNVKFLVSGAAAVAALGAAAAGMTSVVPGRASTGQAGAQVQPVTGTFAQGAWGGRTAWSDDPDDPDPDGGPDLDPWGSGAPPYSPPGSDYPPDDYGTV